MTDFNRAVFDAKNDLSTIDAAIRGETETAANAIRMKYAERRAEALRQVRAAEASRDAALEAESRAHPWYGKRVVRHHGGGDSKWVDVGTVEVRTATTVMPGHMVNNLPAMGELFVRLARRDGQPGKNLALLRAGHRWQLDNTKGDVK